MRARAAIDRNRAGAHALIGLGKHFVGRDDEAEAHVLEALRISPRDTRAGGWMASVGFAKLHSGRDQEAVAWLNRSIELNPNAPVVHFCLAAALAHLGQLEHAREAARAGLELDPSFTVARLRSMAFATIRSGSRGASACTRACGWPRRRRGQRKQIDGIAVASPLVGISRLTGCANARFWLDSRASLPIPEGPKPFTFHDIPARAPSVRF
jgi:tetratricopeptide (TPR) repeat protein